jgi:hypothetical protein
MADNKRAGSTIPDNEAKKAKPDEELHADEMQNGPCTFYLYRHRVPDTKLKNKWVILAPDEQAKLVEDSAHEKYESYDDSGAFLRRCIHVPFSIQRDAVTVPPVLYAKWYKLYKEDREARDDALCELIYLVHQAQRDLDQKKGLYLFPGEVMPDLASDDE